MASLLLPVLAFALFLVMYYALDRGRRATVGEAGLGEPVSLVSRRYGMGAADKRDVSVRPLGGLSTRHHGGTVRAARCLVPTIAFRWEDVTSIEHSSWTLVPFIADGVRFRTNEECFIFWTGVGWRTASVLDQCEAASLRAIGRTKKRAPMFGCG